MGAEEIIRHAFESSQSVQHAMSQHNLAVQAFSVACARHDWVLAEKEHQLALHYMDAYLTALMSCHRLSEEHGKETR